MLSAPRLDVKLVWVLAGLVRCRVLEGGAQGG